jgi:hypothetical protein
MKYKEKDMMNRTSTSAAPWRRTALVALCAALAMPFASGMANAAAYTYKISVVASFPTGSNGKTLAATQPVNTKFTPCTAAKLDAITFTLTYDAGKIVGTNMQDVYLFLYNPDSPGKFYTFQRGVLGSSPVLTARADVAALDTNKATDIYVKAAQNPGSGAITETVLGGYINLEGVTTGTWQLVAIIADSTAVGLTFDDPTTWSAWDSTTVIFGKPWIGAAFQACL